MTIAPGVTIYIHDVVLCIVLFVGVLRVFAKKKYIRPALLLPIVSFILVGAVSLLFNYFRFKPDQIGQSALYLLRWSTYAGLYLLIVQEIVSAPMLFAGLFGFGTTLSVFGLVQYVFYPELRNLSYLGWDPHYFRLFSTLFDPNFAGILIVLTFFLGIYMRRKMVRKTLILAHGVNVLALYLTYSRSSFVAFIVWVLCLIIFYKKWKWLALLAVFILALVIIPKPGGKTLLLTRMDSSVARLGNWQESIGIIARAPIIGNGFNTLRFVRSSDVDNSPSRAAAGLDSSILFLLATTGSIGTVVYGWIFWSLIRLYRTVFGGLLYSVLAALLVHSVFTNSLFYPWVMIWLWVFVGAGELMIRKKI
jgi:hypothetical protein